MSSFVASAARLTCPIRLARSSVATIKLNGHAAQRAVVRNGLSCIQSCSAVVQEMQLARYESPIRAS